MIINLKKKLRFVNQIWDCTYQIRELSFIKKQKQVIMAMLIL
jgi:hypothetical protein